jgi:rhodanese-related sulfurtransferase
MVQKSATDMVKAAKHEIDNLSAEQAQEEITNGNVTVIDIRETEEVKQNGKIAGAVNAPRGMLEFYADASLPYHKPEFNKEKRIIFYCASGGRSALALKTLKEMGYTNIAHIDGGLKAWEAAGLALEK